MKKKRHIKLLMSYGWTRNEAVQKAREDRWFAHMRKICGLEGIKLPCHPTPHNPYPFASINIELPGDLRGLSMQTAGGHYPISAILSDMTKRSRRRWSG